MSNDKEEQGMLVAEGTVKPEWIDLNNHMNVAYYVLAFDKGVDTLWNRVGITGDYIQGRNMSTFAVEAHITYQNELKEGNPYRVTAQILAIDGKRVHQMQRLYNTETGDLAATAEWLNLHIDLKTRRVCSWPEDILAAFTAVAKSQPGDSLPVETGRQIKVKAPLFALSGYQSNE